MRKSDFTGSIASVKASELTTTTPTMAQALAGKVAGVEVRQADGAPGEGVQIRVRGVNSLSASGAIRCMLSTVILPRRMFTSIRAISRSSTF